MLQHSLYAQQTLADYIESGKRNSYTSLSANNNLKQAALAFAVFKADGKPTLSFYGNVPVYNKDNYAVTQPDGSIKFLPRSQNYSNIGFGFSQPIPSTGGAVSVNTDLYRFDDFVTKTKQYNGTPVFLRLTQPLFRYNAFKWNRKIEPLKSEEAGLQYKATHYQLAYEICRLYFDVVTAQADEQLAAINTANNAANLAIEKRKVQLGVSTEDKVLQLEMQQINSLQNRVAAQLSIRQAFLALQTFVNSTDTATVLLQLPKQLPQFKFDKETAIAAAKKNMPQYLSYQRKKLETESKIEEARMQGRQVDLIASFGLNNAATNLTGIYRNPQDQQRFSIGFNIPIADWGRRKNSLASAKLQQEQIDISNKQEEAELVKEITNLVNEFPVLQQNLQQAILLDTLSQRRYNIANRLFQSGKLSLLELQSAQTEKDNARRNYIAVVRRLWESYYLFKVKTGIDNL